MKQRDVRLIDRHKPNTMIQDIQYTICDDIAVITLNRPERLNAFPGVMGEEWSAAFGVHEGAGTIWPH